MTKLYYFWNESISKCETFTQRYNAFQEFAIRRKDNSRLWTLQIYDWTVKNQNYIVNFFFEFTNLIHGINWITDTGVSQSSRNNSLIKYYTHTIYAIQKILFIEWIYVNYNTRNWRQRQIKWESDTAILLNSTKADVVSIISNTLPKPIRQFYSTVRHSTLHL